MKQILIFTILFILISTLVSAALIGGRIYDYSLNTASDATIEINTQPKQREIAKQGVYAFNVPAGQYTISATQHEDGTVTASTHEKITVKQDGEYKLDLILFPNLEEDKQLANTDIIIEPVFEEETSYIKIIILVFLFMIGITLYHWTKVLKKKTDTKTENTDLQQILSFIKQHGNRTTQKDIRKHFPSSEAKISLIITQLESEGKIKKIKKGRGNIIVLK
jgi:uncharacterized membrane protein